MEIHTDGEVSAEPKYIYIKEYTEICYKAGPRFRDLASWPPQATGASSRNLQGVQKLL